MTLKKEKQRCSWVPEGDKEYTDYHDHEWGVPLHDERKLFELLNLEGAQAGLSWQTILHKRLAYRRAFDRFDAKKIARYTAVKEKQLLADAGIVRNRLKIRAVIDNARAYLLLCKEFGSLDSYLWQFTDGKTLVRPGKKGVVLSEALSRDLKRRGFRFVGPTICYAFMQAMGMVDDHQPQCFLRKKKG